MTTQLIIDGREVVLPQNFSVTVKRENSFFTKSGEYTYDVTLGLDNDVNRSLYGFLGRINKADRVASDRKAVLIANGHVYCRGTEVITRWTDETVTLQIVSGESELNYFIGQDRKIEDLDLGKVGPIATEWMEGQTPVYSTDDYCLVPVRTQGGRLLNTWTVTNVSEEDPNTHPYDPDQDETGGNYHTIVTCQSPMPQPYLCPLIERILQALGYNDHDSHYEPVNQLKGTTLGKLFLVNTTSRTDYAKMLPGWTVKELFEEVEKLTGCVFITRNNDSDGYPKCDILLKARYYQDADRMTIRNVADAYEAEISDDESRTAEFTASDVSYDLPDHRWAPIMRLPEGAVDASTVEEFDDLKALKTAAQGYGFTDKVILKDSSTGRMYIRGIRREEWASGTHEDTWLMEVDQFADIDREDNESTLDLKITPAPMAWLGMMQSAEMIDLGSDDGFRNTSASESTADEEEEMDFEERLRNFTKEEAETADLYAAFYNGTTIPHNATTAPMAYTDSGHAIAQGDLYGFGSRFTMGGATPVGSLRLGDIERELYQDGYEIDTRHAYTIETYDPNVAGPRAIFVARNKTFVCRDIEEVITAEGRQKRWKMTLYPIRLPEAELEGWVLEDGSWNDDAPWLDDGRWND